MHEFRFLIHPNPFSSFPAATRRWVTWGCVNILPSSSTSFNLGWLGAETGRDMSFHMNPGNVNGSVASRACQKLLEKVHSVASRTCQKLLEQVHSIASRARQKLLEKVYSVASWARQKFLEKVYSVASRACQKLLEKVYSVASRACQKLPENVHSVASRACWSAGERTFSAPPPHPTLLHLCKTQHHINCINKPPGRNLVAKIHKIENVHAYTCGFRSTGINIYSYTIVNIYIYIYMSKYVCMYIYIYIHIAHSLYSCI